MIVNEARNPQTNEIRAISFTLMGFKATAESAVTLGFCAKPEQRKIPFCRKKPPKLWSQREKKATSFTSLPKNSLSSLPSIERVFGFIL